MNEKPMNNGRAFFYLLYLTLACIAATYDDLGFVIVFMGLLINLKPLDKP